MFKVIRNFARSYERYMTYRGRVTARENLLRLDDRLLADNGFSRELLEQGIKGWPWRTEGAQDTAHSSKSLRPSQSQVITDLKSLSDSELQDLGITRGAIEQAVVSGREDNGIYNPLKVA